MPCSTDISLSIVLLINTVFQVWIYAWVIACGHTAKPSDSICRLLCCSLLKI